MLRMYILQQRCSLSDEGLEDAVHDSQAMRGFVGIDPTREQVPDATTLLKLRRLLEDKQLTQAMFEQINAHLGAGGLLMREGTLVDATIIAAPPSTKNDDHARDFEMHQAKKANQWHFSMKAHIGVDAESGLVHADAGYTGVDKRAEIIEAQQDGDIRKDVKWHVAAKRGLIKAMPGSPLKALTVLVER